MLEGKDFIVADSVLYGSQILGIIVCAVAGLLQWLGMGRFSACEGSEPKSPAISASNRVELDVDRSDKTSDSNQVKPPSRKFRRIANAVIFGIGVSIFSTAWAPTRQIWLGGWLAIILAVGFVVLLAFADAFLQFRYYQQKLPSLTREKLTGR